CTAANRFYVHAEVVDEFVTKFGDAVAALKVGPASDEASQIGPVISEKARAGIAALVDSAVADGARVAVQGAVPDAGSFFPPTILVDVPMDARILAEEIFGPVAPIVTWSDEAAMLDAVNGTEFGLAAYVY
ncbi:aldehyde dehydrogenase family protein, partial [Nocardioides sp.]|uniref:aldehyde dehydrogenase family protein n=1 Tax=Nocardioides sp. TaxID=35761 RepID=UPI0025E17E0A